MSQYQFMANVNIPDTVRVELDQSNPLWGEFTARQRIPGGPHKDTRCIRLRFAESFQASYNPKSHRQATPASMMLPHTTALVNRVLANMNVETVGNVMAVALAPGGQVSPHEDAGPYPDHFERFHIVVASPPGNFFLVQGEVTFPQVGDVFFFNHRATHSVSNPSSKDWRVHLIVDVTLKDHNVLSTQ